MQAWKKPLRLTLTSLGVSSALMALQAAGKGDCNAASRIFGPIVAGNSNRVAALNALAECESRTGHPERATASFLRVTRILPNTWEAWNNLGGNYLALKKPEQAVDVLEKAVKLKPLAISPLINLAGAYEQIGKSKESYQALDRAHRIRPDDKQLDAARLDSAARLATEAAALINQRNYNAARTLLRLIEGPLEATASWHNLIGYVEFKLKNDKPALDHLQKALAMEPDNEDYLLDVAELLSYHEAFDQLRNIFLIALQRMPESPRVQYGLAINYLQDNQLEPAKALLEQLVIKHPGFEAANVAVGEAYEYEGNVDALLEVGRKLQSVNPANPHGPYFEGAAYLRRAREGGAEGPKAVAAFKRAIELDPTSPRAHFQLSRAYSETGDDTSAEAELKNTLQLDPKHPKARYVLGRIYQKQGKTELARRELSAHAKLKTIEDKTDYRRLIITSRAP